MVYRKAPRGHTEFGGGPGLIDPEVRKDRVGMTNEELMLELKFSNPNDATTKPEDVDLNYRPAPKPTPWDDPRTAKGTVEP